MHLPKYMTMIAVKHCVMKDGVNYYRFFSPFTGEQWQVGRNESDSRLALLRLGFQFLICCTQHGVPTFTNVTHVDLGKIKFLGRIPANGIKAYLRNNNIRFDTGASTQVMMSRINHS